MRRSLFQLVVVLVLLLLAAETLAVTPFKKAFLQRYVDGTDNTEFQRAVRKANCNLCHVKGEKKDVCNEYGAALGVFIEGNAEQRLKSAKEEGRHAEELAKLLSELEVAFQKVEAQSSTTGETYGDRIRAGLLPVSPTPPENRTLAVPMPQPTGSAKNT